MRLTLNNAHQKHLYNINVSVTRQLNVTTVRQRRNKNTCMNRDLILLVPVLQQRCELEQEKQLGKTCQTQKTPSDANTTRASAVGFSLEVTIQPIVRNCESCRWLEFQSR